MERRKKINTKKKSNERCTMVRILLFVEYLLKRIIQSDFLILYLFILSLLYTYVNMTESSKKRKRNSNSSNSGSNQTVAIRGNIDANWKKFLSSSIMNQTTEKPTQEDRKEHFAGTFRRARKKASKQNNLNNLQKNDTSTMSNIKVQETSKTVETNLKSLNINTMMLDSESANNIKNTDSKKTPDNHRNKLTKFLALDCEMVGIGPDGNDNMLARVSIVNKFGDCIYDKYVKAREEVVDYRTSVSGIRKEDMLNGEDFNVVQKEVADILKGRVLVGHALSHDLSVLFLSHPKRNIRDTSKYKPFKQITKGSTPSLKRLAKEILGADIQSGEHSSVDDARAVMQLYYTVAKKWENELSQKRGYSKKFLEE